MIADLIELIIWGLGIVALVLGLKIIWRRAGR